MRVVSGVRSHRLRKWLDINIAGRAPNLHGRRWERHIFEIVNISGRHGEFATNSFIVKEEEEDMVSAFSGNLPRYWYRHRYQIQSVPATMRGSLTHSSRTWSQHSIRRYRPDAGFGILIVLTLTATMSIHQWWNNGKPITYRRAVTSIGIGATSLQQLRRKAPYSCTTEEYGSISSNDRTIFQTSPKRVGAASSNSRHIEPSSQRHVSYSDQDVQRRSVLVVRILDVEEDLATESRINDELNKFLFTGNAGVTSVMQQMKLCSGGQIEFEPADAGILSVVVAVGPEEQNRDVWVEATAATVMEDTVLSVNRSNYDISTIIPISTGVRIEEDYIGQLRNAADHVIVILPPSYPDESFLAHAEVNHSISVFSSAWATSLSALMHELGHNIMLRHAGGLYSGEPYGDTTGYMGRSISAQGSPLRCYNAAQHWLLGWYPSKQRLSIPSSELVDGSTWPVLVKVAAFVDHDKLSPDDGFVVLVQLDIDTYLQFNRAKDYNIGTGMMADEIVIVRDNGNSTRLLSGLRAGSTPVGASIFRYDTTNSAASKVAVKVCAILIQKDNSLIDNAIIAIDKSDMYSDDSMDEVCRSVQMSAPTSSPQFPVSSAGDRPLMSPTETPHVVQVSYQATLEPTWRSGTKSIEPTTANSSTTSSPVASSNRPQNIFTYLQNAALEHQEVFMISTLAFASSTLCLCYCYSRRRRKPKDGDCMFPKNIDEKTVSSLFTAAQLY